MLYDNLKIDQGELPSIETIDFEEHPKRYLRYRLVSLFLFGFILFVIFSTVAFIKDRWMLAAIVGGGWVLLLVLAWLAERKAFPYRGYLVRVYDISYRKGWIFKSLVSIPYNRIQHSEISQGPIARMMRLSTLKIYTAGGSSADLSIHGLEPEEANKLREWITDKTAANV